VRRAGWSNGIVCSVNSAGMSSAPTSTRRRQRTAQAAIVEQADVGGVEQADLRDVPSDQLLEREIDVGDVEMLRPANPIGRAASTARRAGAGGAEVLMTSIAVIAATAHRDEVTSRSTTSALERSICSAAKPHA
jgi:hypothetical protein